MGALLFDIGKMKLPDEILNDTKIFTQDKIDIIKKHVDESVRLLNEVEGLNNSIIQVASDHHERFDGSGYPKGKSGKNISLFSSIAGLVDSYDAMTSERTYAKAIKHDAAVNQLYERKNIYFSEELIEHFIQCLGTYPTGTLVELSSGEVGVVIEQNRVRRLRPKVMILLNRKKESNNYFPIFNLLTELEDMQGNPIAINKSLESHAYGIDPEKYYL